MINVDVRAVAIGSTFIAIMGGLAFLMYAEAKQWEAFRIEHACRVVERMPSRTTFSPGIDGNGKMIMLSNYEPPRTAWLCNDGVKYWR